MNIFKKIYRHIQLKRELNKRVKELGWTYKTYNETDAEFRERIKKPVD